MPRRREDIRFETPDAQGEGSFVTVRQLLGVEAYEYSDVSQAYKAKPSQETYWSMVEYVGRLVVAWNWVDGAGNPMPTPSEQISILRGLNVWEINGLLDAVASMFKEEPEKIKN